MTKTATHFGLVRAISHWARNSAVSPVETSVSYINNLYKRVIIVPRFGIPFSIMPERKMNEDQLIIRVIHEIKHQAVIEFRNTLSQRDKKETSERAEFRKAFDFNQDNFYGGAKLILDYSVGIDELNQYGGTLYHNELDLVISTNDIEDVCHHPHSDTGRRFGLLERDQEEHPAAFGLWINLVDNSEHYGDRFINISDKVYRIVAHKEETRRTGVYLVSNNPITGKFDKDDPSCLTYATFEEADKIGIYKTHEEATALGDLSSKRKMEITKLEHELQLLKNNLQLEKQKFESEALQREHELRMEFQTAKQRHDIDMLEREKEIKTLQNDIQIIKQNHEKKMLERDEEIKSAQLERDLKSAQVDEERHRLEHEMSMERQRLKDEYEDRSHKRKEQSEIMKHLPVIIAGIGTIIMTIKAMKK